MRSSKSRSRNKNNNRNRSGGGGGGNVMNRVFDSNGPEGKVRGTPQQIIEKYGQLARDATLANDRVAAESFQQHAEHYTRLLTAAQVEIDARREQQEREHRERQQARNDQQQNDQQQQGGQPPPQQQQQADKQPEPAVAADLSQTDQPDIAPLPPEGDSGLVDTPEAAPVKRRAPRARKPKADAKAASQAEPKGDTKPDEPKAAE